MSCANEIFPRFYVIYNFIVLSSTIFQHPTIFIESMLVLWKRKITTLWKSLYHFYLARMIFLKWPKNEFFCNIYVLCGLGEQLNIEKIVSQSFWAGEKKKDNGTHKELHRKMSRAAIRRLRNLVEWTRGVDSGDYPAASRPTSSSLPTALRAADAEHTFLLLVRFYTRAIWKRMKLYFLDLFSYNFLFYKAHFAQVREQG